LINGICQCVEGMVFDLENRICIPQLMLIEMRQDKSVSKYDV
jgi:hypothetical protein